ncbi:MAG: hypothetical protein ACYC2P_11535 [Paludibacteraceae bacterium]
MKKIIAAALLLILLVSCGSSSSNKNEQSQNEEYVTNQVQIDTSELTMEALRNKKLPDEYNRVGDIKTEVLVFTGFENGDVSYFIFKNLSDQSIKFSGNITKIPLTLRSRPQNIESVVPSESALTVGNDNIANPLYINKKFRVAWRTVQLNRKPQNETENYYEKYDEIIYLKAIN